MLISDAASGFLNYMSAQGLSKSTIGTAAIVLRHMQRVTGPIDVADIQPSHIDGMFSNQEWGMGTRNNYLMHVRGFMKWCRTHKLVAPDYDPCAGWRTHKVVKRQKTWLTLPVLASMLMNASPRDRAFMALGIFTFMRASEIAALKVGDLDFNDNEIDIFRIKTKQEDRIPMCIELRQEMTHWFLHYRDMCGDLDPDWLVIPSQHPTPMKGVPGVRKLVPTGAPAKLKPTVHVSSPHLIVRKAMQRQGIVLKQGDGCHILRRSGARNLFEELRNTGHDGAARRVQSMLGHSSVVMTELYLGIDNEKRQRNQMLAGKPMFHTEPMQPVVQIEAEQVLVLEAGAFTEIHDN